MAFEEDSQRTPDIVRVLGGKMATSDQSVTVDVVELTDVDDDELSDVDVDELSDIDIYEPADDDAVKPTAVDVVLYFKGYKLERDDRTVNFILHEGFVRFWDRSMLKPIMDNWSFSITPFTTMTAVYELLNEEGGIGDQPAPDHYMSRLDKIKAESEQNPDIEHKDRTTRLDDAIFAVIENVHLHWKLLIEELDPPLPSRHTAFEDISHSRQKWFAEALGHLQRPEYDVHDQDNSQSWIVQAICHVEFGLTSLTTEQLDILVNYMESQFLWRFASEMQRGRSSTASELDNPLLRSVRFEIF